MIPKTIHYCWFGRGAMPELATKCMDSWRTHLPDYQWKLWNEESFNVNHIPYTKQAYENRKFAFVTDYVRLYALYTEGGIYMDTDVEVLKNLDHFLHLPAFSGFESETEIPTGIMAAEKNSTWAKEQLSYYEGRHFVQPDGTLDTTTNVAIISDIMRKGGFKFDNSLQNYRDQITIFPKDYFCPKSYLTNRLELTENSHTIHHFASSWQTPWKKMKIRLLRLLGKRFTQWYIQSFKSH